MKLFLMRHAKAVDTYPDEERKLSERGEKQLKSLCAHIDKSHFENVVQIWHSPYKRAKQTAEIVKKEMCLKAELLKVPNITPHNSPHEIARTIASLSSFSGDLIIVSHNPFLEELANLLLNSYTCTPRIRFHTATIAALILEDDSFGNFGIWSAEFIANPSLFA